MHLFTLCATAVSIAAFVQSTCPPTLLPARPGKHLCGPLRTPTETQPLLSSVVATQEDCVNSCFNDSSCKSFTFDATTGACQTYSRSFKGLDLIKSPDGQTRFYNKKCFYIPDSCAPPSRFRLQASAPGKAFDGTYIYVYDQSADFSYPYDVTAFTNLTTLATVGTVFALNSGGNLVDTDNNQTSAQLVGQEYSATVFFPTPGLRETIETFDSSFVQLADVTCAIDPASFALSCQSALGSFFFGCDGGDYNIGWAMGQENESGPEYYDPTCVPMNLTAVAA